MIKIEFFILIPSAQSLTMSAIKTFIEDYSNSTEKEELLKKLFDKYEIIYIVYLCQRSNLVKEFLDTISNNPKYYIKIINYCFLRFSIDNVKDNNKLIDFIITNKPKLNKYTLGFIVACNQDNINLMNFIKENSLVYPTNYYQYFDEIIFEDMYKKTDIDKIFYKPYTFPMENDIDNFPPSEESATYPIGFYLYRCERAELLIKLSILKGIPLPTISYKKIIKIHGLECSYSIIYLNICIKYGISIELTSDDVSSEKIYSEKFGNIFSGEITEELEDTFAEELSKLRYKKRKDTIAQYITECVSEYVIINYQWVYDTIYGITYSD